MSRMWYKDCSRKLDNKIMCLLCGNNEKVVCNKCTREILDFTAVMATCFGYFVMKGLKCLKEYSYTER